MKNNKRISVPNNNAMDGEALLSELINDYSKSKYGLLAEVKTNNITEEAFMEDVESHVAQFYRVSEEVKEEGIKKFRDYLFGYSRLTPLISEKGISDIHCIDYKTIRIKKNGKRMGCDIQFRSKEEFAQFVDYVATRNKANISNLNAIQRFTDTVTSDDYILRFTVVMPIVNTYDSPYLCIRKIPKNFPLINDLATEDHKMLTDDLGKILVDRFVNGSTIICGGNSSGKTTLLNALKETIPHDKSVLIAQQADELTTKSHPDMFFLHSLPGSNESQAIYDLKDISVGGLTMDIDYFIIGEIKGDEAAYLLNAAYTGQICAATIHSYAADKAIDKVIDYAMMNTKYTKSDLLKMLDCFRTVIFMKDYKVTQVYAVTGYDEALQKITYEPIYVREE